MLYDKYHEAELSRLDLNDYLPNLYRTQSELVVIFLCPNYKEKQWCMLEWRAIQKLIGTAEKNRIMLCSFGNPGDISEIGIYSGDGYAEIGNRSPTEIAELILQRLDQETRKKAIPGKPRPTT